MATAISGYESHSRFSDPGGYASLLQELPSDPGALCECLQGLLVHLFGLRLYGLKLPAQERANGDIEHVRRLILKILARDSRPLSVARPLERRVGVICRQYVLLACSALRQHGIPALSRGGFANYLAAGRWVGHGVCEYCCKEKRRWVRFDPQLDAVQKRAHNIAFDVLDVPGDVYMSGAEAWTAYRSGTLAPEVVEGGVADLRNGVILDLWESCKLETHRYRPPLMTDPTRLPTAQEAARIDAIADACLAAQANFAATWAIYESEPGVQIDVAP